MGNIIRVQASGKQIAGEQPDHVRQRDDPFLGVWLKTTPVKNMLFRPEEIHCASSIGDVFEPVPKRYGCIRHRTFRFGILDYTVFHSHVDRGTAIETRCIDLDSFTRKEPTDRQRLESSLGEPFLLTLDSDPVLGGKVVKGCERGDVVGIRIQPTGKSREKKLMQCPSPFLR